MEPFLHVLQEKPAYGLTLAAAASYVRATSSGCLRRP